VNTIVDAHLLMVLSNRGIMDETKPSYAAAAIWLHLVELLCYNPSPKFPKMFSNY